MSDYCWSPPISTPPPKPSSPTGRFYNWFFTGPSIPRICQSMGRRLICTRMKFAPIDLVLSFRSHCPTVKPKFSITMKNTPDSLTCQATADYSPPPKKKSVGQWDTGLYVHMKFAPIDLALCKFSNWLIFHQILPPHTLIRRAMGRRLICPLPFLVREQNAHSIPSGVSNKLSPAAAAPAWCGRDCGVACWEDGESCDMDCCDAFWEELWLFVPRRAKRRRRIWIILNLSYLSCTILVIDWSWSIITV